MNAASKSRPAVRWLSAVLAGLLLGGCWDRQELEQLGFVSMVAFDRAETGELVTTVFIVLPAELVQGGEQGQEVSPRSQAGLVATVRNHTLGEAIREIQTFINRRVTFVHNRVILLGEGLLREGFADILGVLVRFRQFRRSMVVFATRGPAGMYTTIQPTLESDPSLFLIRFVELGDVTGAAQFTRLHEVVKELESHSTQLILPLLELREVLPQPSAEDIGDAPQGELDATGQTSGGSDAEGESSGGSGGSTGTRTAVLAGAALFDGDRMVGVIDREETIYVRMLRGQRIDRLNFPVEYEFEGSSQAQWVSLELAVEGYHVRVDISGERPRIHASLIIDAKLIELQGLQDIVSQDALHRLGRQTSNRIQHNAENIVKRMQEQGLDIFDFGRFVRRQMWTWKQWVEYDWLKRFSDAEFNIDVEVNIRRTGETFQTPEPKRFLGE